MKTTHFPAEVGVILLLGLLVPILGSLASVYYWPEWRWQQVACHAAVEAAGACIALVLAGLLLMLWYRKRELGHHVWMASALVGMGILDGFHALVMPSNLFVWLRSTATLVGGVLFAGIWLPPLGMGEAWRGRLPGRVAVGALAFGLLSLLQPEGLPLMFSEGHFTWLARSLNVMGGIGFFLAALRFINLYWERRDADDFFFAIHCSLFGAAGVLFELSIMWDGAWWWWHLLRLLAYGVALRFVVVTFERTEEEIQSLNKDLEKRVALRTAEAEARAQELARSNAELEVFAYVASHDLQEPLRMVTSYVEMLANKYQGQLDDKADRWIHFAVDGAHYMKQLINDLLGYSRVGTHGKPFVSTDCAQVLATVLKNLEPALQETQARVTYGPLPTLPGDRTQLIQLLQNLIGNAIKFCRAGAIAIQVEAKRQGAFWVFSVKDNGIGLDPQFADQVFLIFKRLHTRQEYPGTGIGLAVCQKIVQRHGGRIWVESQPGQGATFFFTLPAGS